MPTNTNWPHIPLYLVMASILSSPSRGTTADWPQWRGLHRDGFSQDTGLLQKWPKGGPQLRWQVLNLGNGYSSPTISKGQLYLQTTRGGREFAIAFAESTGEVIWEVPIGKVGSNRGPQYPGTRSTPTVDDARVYCLASDGTLTCLETASGKQTWQHHLTKDFAGKVGNWAYSESVLIDGDRLVCTPGGAAATLLALNKHTGEPIWKSVIGVKEHAEYASAILFATGNSRQYVQFLSGGVVGVDAVSGKPLWRYPKTAGVANIMTPIATRNRIFSSGSRTGGALLEIQTRGETTIAKELYLNRGLSASIGGVIVLDQHLYGTTSNSLFCANFETGKLLWSARAAGAASLCVADGRIYVRGHTTGDVLLVEPSGKSFQPRGKLKQPHRSNTRAWPHPVVANGSLFLRDQGTLLCYDVESNAN
ncbi:MAG: PQQ-binding-like beta-propeller repeat protein [Planctomycetota bacterium]|nr:PQQ-binding-like beta-propeller repeat protein [Planctomycetota bacterium]